MTIFEKIRSMHFDFNVKFINLIANLTFKLSHYQHLKKLPNIILHAKPLSCAGPSHTVDIFLKISFLYVYYLKVSSQKCIT